MEEDRVMEADRCFKIMHGVEGTKWNRFSEVDLIRTQLARHGRADGMREATATTLMGSGVPRGA